MPLPIKSDKELLVDLRNTVSFRIVENKANIYYWKYIAKHSKTNSPQIIEALQAKKINEDNMKKDLVFLKCIDEMMKGKF